MDDEERTKRLETLLAIDERITALEATRGDRKPWWRNAALVAAYGGLITLVPTAITGIAGWIESKRELELADKRQQHERTLAYLGLAVDPSSTEVARSQVLRFLASLEDDPVAVWANTELELVQGKIADLVDERAEVVAQIEQTDVRAKAAQTQAAELRAQAEADPKLARDAAKKNAESQQLAAELQRKRDKADALAMRVGEPSLQILQLRESRRPGDEVMVSSKVEPPPGATFER